MQKKAVVVTVKGGNDNGNQGAREGPSRRHCHMWLLRWSNNGEEGEKEGQRRCRGYWNMRESSLEKVWKDGFWSQRSRQRKWVQFCLGTKLGELRNEEVRGINRRQQRGMAGNGDRLLRGGE